MEHNRSLKRIEKINQVINWSQVEEILLSHYTAGTSRDGADAYPPVIAPEGASPAEFDQHSPDYSTFSRFRGRLSKEVLIK